MKDARIEEATAAPIMVKVATVWYRLSPLTFSDVGEFRMWSRSRWRGQCSRWLDGVRDAVADALREWAEQQDCFLEAASDSPEGQVRKLWLHLRAGQPQLTLDDAAALDQADVDGVLWAAARASAGRPASTRTEAGPEDFGPLFRRFAERHGWGPETVGRLTPEQGGLYLDADLGTGDGARGRGRKVHFDSIRQAVEFARALKAARQQEKS